MKKVKLSNFIKQIRGVSYKPEDIRNESDKNAIPILRANNITVDGHIDLNDIVYVDSKKVQNEQLLRAGDIFICASSGSKNLVGKAVYIPTDMPYAFGAFCKVVRPISENLDKHYLAQFFQSPSYRKKISDLAQGANINNIKNEHIDELDIAIYSLEEQKAIAERLDKVSGLIEKRKTQLEKLDLLIKSRFIEMFGDLATPDCQWCKIKLVDACANAEDIKCGPFGTQLSKDEYTDSGVAVWEIPQINNLFATKPTHYLTEEKARQLDAYSLRAGDIAMSRKGNVGKCAVFPANFDAGIIHSDVLRIRVDNRRVLPIFMMHQLHYSGAVKHQIELVSSGAIMAGINVTKLKQIVVHIPPIELQEQYVSFVEQIDKSKFEIQKSLEKLEILKKSLMQQYFG